ncbi:MAG: hypothetical protein RPR91_09200, partial [Colwellia sp.]
MFRGQYIKNVFFLITGTAAAQLINIAFMPFITRIFGPESLGGLGYYSSLLSLLIPLAALCYPLAIILPAKRVEASALFEISLKIAVVISLIIGFSLYGYEYFFKRLIIFDRSYFIIPLGVFLSVLVMAYTQWAISCGQYRLISLVTVLVALVGGIGKVFMGYLFPTTITLVLINLFTVIISAIILSFKTSVSIKLDGLLYLRKRDYVIAKKYLRFAVYRTPHAMMAVISQTAPVFLL